MRGFVKGREPKTDSKRERADWQKKIKSILIQSHIKGSQKGRHPRYHEHQGARAKKH